MSTEIPLFPLPTPLFPRARMRLQIFEPRYLQLVRDCMRSGEGFGIVWIEAGHEVLREGKIQHRLASIGCLAKIVDADQLPNGLLGITVEGQQRLRISDARTQSNGLVMGMVEALPDPSPAVVDAQWGDLLHCLRSLLSHPEIRELDLHADTQSDAWNLVYQLTQLLPLPAADKYALLLAEQASDARDKLELLLEPIGNRSR
jgi:Lon protease-like protein